MDLASLQLWSRALQADAHPRIAGACLNDSPSGGANFTWWVRDGS